MLRGGCGWPVPAIVQPDPTRLGREGRRPPGIAWMRGFAHPHRHRPRRDDPPRARAAARRRRGAQSRPAPRAGCFWGAALDHPPTHAAGLDDHVLGRGRGPARHLGLPRARRQRLRIAPRQRLVPSRARGLAAPQRRRSPGRRHQRAVHLARRRRQRLRARGLRRVRPARGLRDARRAARGARGALRPAPAGSRVPGHARRPASTSIRCGASPSSASSSRSGWPSASTRSCSIVVFMAADHAHHLGWDEWERSGADSPLAKVYGILDEAVGALAGALGGDIMLVSDHGSGPLHGVVNLNAWLAEQGLLEYAGAAELMRGGQLKRIAAAHALAAWRRLPARLPHAREAAAGRPARALVRAAELPASSTSSAPRHSHTGRSATSSSTSRGARATASSPRARSTRPCATRSRRRCASCATRRAAAPSSPPCTGARSSSAARTSIACRISSSSSSTTSGSARATSRAAPRPSGTRSRSPAADAAYVGSHRHEGIVALAGPSAAPGGLFASIEDVAPTIQYLLGEPIPESMEGPADRRRHRPGAAREQAAHLCGGRRRGPRRACAYSKTTRPATCRSACAASATSSRHRA